jgi:hypothetical protein
LYVKDNINVSRRDDLDFDDLEGIWVQIKINGKQILFGIFYIPPKSTQDKCVGSSIICKRLNLVKRKLILVRE